MQSNTQSAAAPLLEVADVSKSFTMHLHGGARRDVLRAISFTVSPGEVVTLGGPSGAGKSSLLKMIHGDYHCDEGAIRIRHANNVVDLASATPRRILALRRDVVGYVSQFLRVIPRISALDIVAAAGREGGMPADEAGARARALLSMLNVPEHLWALPPATFSGGEQQRVNIARGMIAPRPLLLLDEPTASLDARNRAVVVDLIREKQESGVAVVGIFHDEDVRDAVASRIVDVTRFTPVAA